MFFAVLQAEWLCFVISPRRCGGAPARLAGRRRLSRPIDWVCSCDPDFRPDPGMLERGNVQGISQFSDNPDAPPKEKAGRGTGLAGVAMKAAAQSSR